MKINNIPLHKSYFKPFIRLTLVLLIIYGISGTIFLTSTEKKEKPAEVLDKNIESIILSTLNNNQYLSGDNYTTVQNFIKDQDTVFYRGEKFYLPNNYSIFIDRNTHCLMIENELNMTKQITKYTIDSTRSTTSSNVFISNDGTYFMDEYKISKWYLGQETELHVPIQYPKILLNSEDGLIITEDDSKYDADVTSRHLILVNKDSTIEFTNSYSQIPIEKNGHAIYFIDSDLALFMYNTLTYDTTYIAKGVYDLFYSSGVNFRSVDGVFRINLFVDSNGNEKKLDINSNETDLMYSQY